jgi:NitT/TauT family transport system substrate-binding protein
MTRKILSYAILLAAGLALAGGAAADPVRVRFADLGAATANIYQYLGVERGIYAEHGIELLHINFLKGGPEIIAAAASQQVDLGSLGTPILTGISRGMPIKVVGSPPLKRQEFVLLGRPDIASIADLVGKVVGVSSVGGGQAQALGFILKAEKISPAAVKVIAYGSHGNGYVALRSGQLAGVLLSEPMISKAELDGSGHALAAAVDYYGRYQHSYVFASDRFIAEHPRAIRDFFRADREAIAYARAHRDELVAYAAKRLDLDTELAAKILGESMANWDDSLAVDEEGLLNAVHIVQELGDISAGYKPVISEIADLRFLDDNRKESFK